MKSALLTTDIPGSKVGLTKQDDEERTRHSGGGEWGITRGSGYWS